MPSASERAPAAPGPFVLAIVGAGPRGASLIERIAAAGALPRGRALELHLVDEHEAGPGRVWQTAQSRVVSMNTLAGTVTMFADASVSGLRDRVHGPAFLPWCAQVTAGALPAGPGVSEVTQDAGLAAEAAAMQAGSHPSRALYGCYLRWFAERAIAALPAGTVLQRHRTRAVSLTAGREHPELGLADGTRIVADAVVLATGWTPRLPDAADEALAARLAPDAHWVRARHPIEQRLDDLPAGEPVIVRGLGMGFFDTLALLVERAGGRFVPNPACAPGPAVTEGVHDVVGGAGKGGAEPGSLVYLPGGGEAVLYATSPRGVPYRAKSLYGGLPPRAELPRLRALGLEARDRPIAFDAVVWPALVRDSHEAWYRVLARIEPRALSGSPAEVAARLDAVPVPAETARHAGGLERLDAAFAAALAELVPEPAHRLRLARAFGPGERRFGSAAEVDAWVRADALADLREAEQGADSPLKAALWEFAAARPLIARAFAFGGTDAASAQGAYRRYTALGGYAGSGPPAVRIAQMIALNDAGLLHFLGPEPVIDAAGTARPFRAASRAVDGPPLDAAALIDAILPMHDLRRTADPLLSGLLAAGHLRSATLPLFEAAPPPAPIAPGAARASTAGIDVDPATSRIRHADGTIDPAVWLIGIPLEETRGDTVISPLLGADSTMLRETELAARGVIARAASPIRPAAVPESERPTGG